MWYPLVPRILHDLHPLLGWKDIHILQVGQLLFLCNCLASSLEVVVWRRLLRHSGGTTCLTLLV